MNFFPPSPSLKRGELDVAVLLIGNKCDWEERRAVDSAIGEDFAQSRQITFMETSAKTGHNIDEVRGHFVDVTMMSLLKYFPCRLLIS